MVEFVGDILIFYLDPLNGDDAARARKEFSPMERLEMRKLQVDGSLRPLLPNFADRTSAFEYLPSRQYSKSFNEVVGLLFCYSFECC